MKKTVIIGGGVAGLSLAIALRRNGSDVVVCEREERSHSNGHAFLLHPEAMRIWESIVETDPYHLMPGRNIDELFLKNSDNKLVQHLPLEGWVCMKRCEAMHALAAQLPEDIIGADGSRSAVRNALFGPTAFTPVLVKEILGTINNPTLFSRHPNHFTKYLSTDKGLAIGFIPCNDEEVIWFMNFDVSLCPVELNSQEAIAAFCKGVLKDFPEEVREIMECKSVVANYVWNTTDFDLLPTFHRWNVLLIGDAAHVALPFTSAGVTNALLDVDCLISLWDEESNLEKVFHQFYQLRSRYVKGHIETGRQIRSSFLKGAAREVRLPLIQDLSLLAV